jgi:acetyltransferase-like isoleucine patch superfamily enzyme
MLHNDGMDKSEFKKILLSVMENQDNQFHPFVFVGGTPKVGKNVYIGLFSEVNAKGAEVTIGDDCDIASFVSINVADSHKKCIGISNTIERENITIENNVFIGSHTFVKKGAHIGHHCVVAAGTIVEGVVIPPFSLVIGNPMKVKEGYYRDAVNNQSHDSAQ